MTTPCSPRFVTCSRVSKSRVCNPFRLSHSALKRTAATAVRFAFFPYPDRPCPTVSNNLGEDEAFVGDDGGRGVGGLRLGSSRSGR